MNSLEFEPQIRFPHGDLLSNQMEKKMHLKCKYILCSAAITTKKHISTALYEKGNSFHPQKY